MDANEQAELARYREQAAEATITASVASSLADRQLADGAAEQLTTLFRSQIQLVQGGDGRPVALGPGGQSVRDFVSGQLAKPEYKKFVGANDRGGSGPSQPAAAGGTGPGGAPATLAEAIRMKLAETKRTPGDWRHDRSVPMPTEPSKG